MRLHALLSWFDEPCSALAATIASLKHAGVDSVIATDGAYALYPSNHAISPPDQSQTIHAVSRELGIASTIHTPIAKWDGGEVQKRTALFDLAWALSEPGDWWFVIDADEVVTSAPLDLKHRLENTDLHVGQCTLTQLRNLDDPAAQRFNWTRAGSFPFRMLFKAQPIRCHTNHYTYVTHDGRILWASDSASQDRALVVEDLHVEHRDNQRAQDRIEDKDTYYKRRDQLGIERGECHWPNCNEQAHHWTGHGFKRSTNDLGYEADLIEVCDAHLKRAQENNNRKFKQWGIDPATVHAELRDGVAA